MTQFNLGTMNDLLECGTAKAIYVLFQTPVRMPV